MTLKELLIYFEKFYGEKYDGVFKNVMLEYLEGYSEYFYSSCAEIIVKRFSRIYNKVPDVAIIEKNLDEILASMPKPKMIEAPVEIITDEEWTEGEKGHNELVEILNNKKSEGKPMAKYLDKMFEVFKEAV
jgi:hypothetical protein